MSRNTATLEKQNKIKTQDQAGCLRLIIDTALFGGKTESELHRNICNNPSLHRKTGSQSKL